MNKYQTGTVVLVKFHPGYGAEFAKYRPAVIVSETIEDIDNRFVLIAPLTTDLKKYQPKHELLLKNYTFLDKESVALCWYLRTIDAQRVVSVLGKLTKKNILDMKQKTSQVLAIE